MAYFPTGQPRGRPPKPEHLRHGHRKGHLTVVQPEQQAQPRRVPRAPAGLLPQTRALWRAYWQSAVAQAADPLADAFLLERWIRAVDEWERVSESFREVRFLWHDDRLVLNPLARYLGHLERTIAYAETQLGLTPATRTRLGLTMGPGLPHCRRPRPQAGRGTAGARSAADRPRCRGLEGGLGASLS